MKAVFLDRDGVINKEVNYLHRVEDFEFTEGCIEGLQRFKEKGFQFIVVTNQAGIAKGYYSETQYQTLTSWMRNALRKNGIEILDVLHCPHHPDGVVEDLAIHCACRKPEPGMIITAMARHEIDLTESILVGDKVSDAEAGLRAGIEKCYLVKTGHDLPTLINDRIEVLENLIDVANNI